MGSERAGNDDVGASCPKVFPSLDTQHLHRIVAVGSGLALTVIAAVDLAVVPFFVALLRRSRAIPVKDTRPMPRSVTYALWTIFAMLVVVGLPLLLQVDNIFPWELTPKTSTIFGCNFLGASGYFFYVARQPYWVFGAAPLLGFLGYDVVLFSPYVDLLRTPSQGLSASYGTYDSYGYYGSYATTAAGNGVNERSLAVYLAVIGVSALLATILLFIYPATRLRFRSLQNLRRPALVARNAA
jgi:hypothetical protein